jgi:DnaJ-class molecular chaperone
VLNSAPGDILSPGTIRAIQKEGMPIHKNPYEKGNLYVKFDVKFPENNTLSEEAIKVRSHFFFVNKFEQNPNKNSLHLIASKNRGSFLLYLQI